jgi:hypothetical protein
MKNPPAIIGRSEQLDLVDLDAQVPTKIDTGAYHSAIHCTKIVELERSGQKILQAELLGHPSSPKAHSVDFPEYELVAVRNSFGDQEIRYKIKLRVKLGSKTFWSSFTLADRTNNLMPVLIGRELLKNRFLVDVSKTSVDRRQLRKTYQANTMNKNESEM